MTITKSSSLDTRVIFQNVKEGPFPTGVILDDSNYPLWSQLMEMRIGARNKMGFIIGDTPKPTAYEKQIETWRSLPAYYNELVSIFQEIDTRLTTQEETIVETARSEILRKDPPLDLDSCYAYIRKDQNQRQTKEESKTDSDNIVHLATSNRTIKGKSSNSKVLQNSKEVHKENRFPMDSGSRNSLQTVEKLRRDLLMAERPKEREELIIYLAAAKEAISAVLITEREGKKMLVYFVSCALRGPEINYTPMEKLVLALLSASRRLKRYFQAHTIVVITDQPIKQLLSNSEITGRMLKWKFELEGYDIQYKPRILIKRQILANFIMERPEEESPDELMTEPEELPEPWTLFTDGSSCIDGSGAGLILTNPEGVEFTYAMRFRFEATNNEAEYEALIAGLRIAEQIGVKNLQANVDSRLVANQVNGSYVAKESGMVQYLEKVKTLTSNFKEFSIKQVPRSENKKADALSKIASTSFAHLSKQVLVEELNEKSINEKEVLAIVEEEGHTWMTPICEYLTKEILPKDKKKARAVRRKASRFGQQGEIVSDNGKPFRDNPFKDWCEKLCICQCFASVKHPQINGLVERANRSLGEGIKARLDERSKDWIGELSHVLWAHRTMIKSSNGETPFSLTYGTKAVINLADMRAFPTLDCERRLESE
ncbi:reverse transcriptase domain-containing protein [Tanacetum coccineum]